MTDDATDAERGGTDDVDLSDPELYLNRELSELAFQRRVLSEVTDDRNPLLERVRFLAIVTRNLDEFVMKRLGGLKQQVEAGVTERTVDGLTPLEQWEATHEQLRPMLQRQAACYETELRPALAEQGIEIVGYDDLDAAAETSLRQTFEQSIKPTLTPLSFDPAHPFPFISNRSLSLAVLTRQPDLEPTFTRIKIPPNRPRLVKVGDDTRYVLIEDVIEQNLDVLLPNVDVLDTALFRLTRNAEVRRDEEVAEDLIEMIQDVLEQRRFASAVRMEIEPDVDPRIRDTLQEQLDLEEREIYDLGGPIDYRDLTALSDLDRPALKPDAWTPRSHPRLTDDQPPAFELDDDGTDGTRSIFESIAEDDILLHHPYHDFDETVQRFLTEAANDDDVLAVKAAIYRTASDSKVIQSLIEAAENGKQVAVMVELKARFDEQNNLEWVRRLEENGIHVAYGTVGLKTHTKTALVVREEGGDVSLYSHVGTGNYHSETAKGYVDLGLLTADRDVGQDLVTLFNSFTGPGLDEQFRKLLVAPVTMREEFTRCIRREARHARAGRPARIVVKVNGLEDAEIVEELYRASIAGVEIDLIVRDICRLRPGLEGISENVSVHSVVGRFLEHSRVFYFENGARAAAAGDEDLVDSEGGQPEYYIGSADWMTRNLDNRVEAVAPVDDPDIRRALRLNLALILADNRRRWTMNADGSYDQQRPDGDEVIDTQAVLMERTAHAAGGGDLDSVVPSEDSLDADILITGEEAADADGSVTALEGPDEPRGDPATNGGVTGTRSEERGATDDAEGRAEDGAGTGAEPVDVLSAHDERWYRPESDTYEYAVRTPDGDRRYLKTRAGAEAALERLYGESAAED